MCVELSSVAPGIRDFALAAAAVTTAVVAVLGLKRWRAELRGKADFDVARGLIRATYKLRDEIQSCRVPLVRLTVRAPEPDPYAPGPQAELDALARAQLEACTQLFKERWQRVSTALQEFDAQA